MCSVDFVKGRITVSVWSGLTNNIKTSTHYKPNPCHQIISVCMYYPEGMEPGEEWYFGSLFYHIWELYQSNRFLWQRNLSPVCRQPLPRHIWSSELLLWWAALTLLTAWLPVSVINYILSINLTEHSKWACTPGWDTVKEPKPLAP